MIDEWVVAQGWLLHDKTDLLRDDRPPDYERRGINAAEAIAMDLESLLGDEIG